MSVDLLLGKNSTLAGKYSTAGVSGIYISSGISRAVGMGLAQSIIEWQLVDNCNIKESDELQQLEHLLQNLSKILQHPVIRHMP